MTTVAEHPLVEETLHQSLSQLIVCSGENGSVLCNPCNTRRNNLLAILDLNDEETLGLRIPEGEDVVLFGALAMRPNLSYPDMLKFCRSVRATLHGAFDHVAVRVSTPTVAINV